jgi:hypothetical protein
VPGTADSSTNIKHDGILHPNRGRLLHRPHRPSRPDTHARGRGPLRRARRTLPLPPPHNPDVYGLGGGEGGHRMGLFRDFVPGCREVGWLGWKMVQVEKEQGTLPRCAHAPECMERVERLGLAGTPERICQICHPDVEKGGKVASMSELEKG